MLDSNLIPKPLTHPDYRSLDNTKMNAFEAIGLTRIDSSQQLLSLSSSNDRLLGTNGMNYLTSTSSVTSLNLKNNVSEMILESFFTTQVQDEVVEDDPAPSEFYLDWRESEVFRMPPVTVTITLKETDTVIIFELPQLSEDARTPEGIDIQKENERYDYITRMPRSLRKLADAETQTINPLTKSRGTYLPKKYRQNKGIIVNNWVINDTYAFPELLMKKGNFLVVRRKESIQRMKEIEERYNKLPKIEQRLQDNDFNEQLNRIFSTSDFKHAVRVVERIIAGNIYVESQKRFKGIVRQDPCSIDLRLTYKLDLLWIHCSTSTKNRPITAFRWNYSNSDLLAVAYEARRSEKINDTRNDDKCLLMIWCTKNPGEPAREYQFTSCVSSLDWSKDKPNQLAVGFYDGDVLVIDVSSELVNVIRRSERSISSCTEPHWQVQWWPGDEQFAYEEVIFTGSQDGRVQRYHTGEDFLVTEMTRIYRLESKVEGVERTVYCTRNDLTISRHAAVLVMCRHPTDSAMYFVGTDEGCIYKCSVNYLHYYMDCFQAHNGPVYSMQFSPFSNSLFLTCGADWCTRIWTIGLFEPLIELSTTMSCVRSACWSPLHSTVIASVVDDEIDLWDISRKVYSPASVTPMPQNENNAKFVGVDFTSNGRQITAADSDGNIYVYNLDEMPFAPYDQEAALLEALDKALITKPELAKKLKE